MIITLGNFAIAKYKYAPPPHTDTLVRFANEVRGVILESEGSQAAFQRYRKGHSFTAVKLKKGHP